MDFGDKYLAQHLNRKEWYLTASLKGQGVGAHTVFS